MDVYLPALNHLVAELFTTAMIWRVSKYWNYFAIALLVFVLLCELIAACFFPIFALAIAPVTIGTAYFLIVLPNKFLNAKSLRSSTRMFVQNAAQGVKSKRFADGTNAWRARRASSKLERGNRTSGSFCIDDNDDNLPDTTTLRVVRRQ